MYESSDLHDSSELDCFSASKNKSGVKTVLLNLLKHTTNKKREILKFL